jgi:hypothetical protein
MFNSSSAASAACTQTRRSDLSQMGRIAQRAAVMSYLNGRWKLLSEFTEIESGKNSDRAQLRAAQAGQ